MTPAEKLAAATPLRRPGRHPRRKLTALRQCRESLKLGINRVAKALSMSVSGYWQIEMGGDPMLSTAKRIAKFYGRTIEELFP